MGASAPTACAVCAAALGVPKQTISQARSAYAAVTRTVSEQLTSSSQSLAEPPSVAASSTTPSTASLEKNPTTGGRPTSASSPTPIAAEVTGNLDHSPPIADIEVVPVACATAPAHRKSRALNAPCDIRWKTPAA
jgi:hypothetical protein